MELHVSSLEAAASLEDLLDRVSGGDTTVIIERDGRAIVKLVPVATTLPQAGKLMTKEDIAAVGAAIRAGRELNDGWAEAVEEAVRLGNQPMSPEDPVGSLIDTGVFIAAERGKLDLIALLAEVSGEPIAISPVTAAELLDGVNRADPARRGQRESVVEDILSRFTVLAFDLPIARIQRLDDGARLGRPIAPHDLMIAATAMSFGYRVITRDAKSFPEIAGLEVMLR